MSKQIWAWHAARQLNLARLFRDNKPFLNSIGVILEHNLMTTNDIANICNVSLVVVNLWSKKEDRLAPHPAKRIIYCTMLINHLRSHYDLPRE